jgi:fumarylacetoacetase
VDRLDLGSCPVARVIRRDGSQALAVKTPSGARFLPADTPLDRLDESAGEAGAEADIGGYHPLLPTGHYVDFYSGIHHAENVGRLFRPDHPPLLPNYRMVPVAYVGWARNVRWGSGTVVRPCGIRPDEPPSFGPTRELDFEIEVAAVLGQDIREPIDPAEAERRILGFVLLNDLSARDIQRLEYQPLGPLLGKAFATFVSPWVVPKAALEPYLGPMMPQEPPALAHLAHPGRRVPHLPLRAEIDGQRVAETNWRYLYWSHGQQIAHLSHGGAQLAAGDLIGSGTLSGPTPGESGSLLELTRRGTTPRVGGRTYLEDGETITLSAAHFGEISVTIAPSGHEKAPSLD